jgi:hypothetical protein
VTRGRGRTRLAVGAVDGTARYPRTAKFLQFGGRFDSEGGALARIHIPQLSERPGGASLVLARSSREMWRFGAGRLCATQQAVWRVVWALCGCGQWRSLGRAVCVMDFAWAEVECAGDVGGGGISI